LYWLAAVLCLLLIVGACGPVVTGPGASRIEQTPVEWNAPTLTQPSDLRDFPVPSGFVAERASISSAGGDPVALGAWKGKGSVEATIAFYQRTLVEQGWAEEYTFARPDGGQTAYSRSGSVATVTLARRGDELQAGVLIARDGYGTGSPGKAGVGSPIAPPTAVALRPATAPAPIPSLPAPTGSAASSSGSATAYALDVPEEMRRVPIPSGFTLVEGSAQRFTHGDGTTLAMTMWTGKGTVADVAEYYRHTMPEPGWMALSFRETNGGFAAQFSSQEDLGVTVGIELTEVSTGQLLMKTMVKSAG
jgi:hypothetical protein